jgi:glycosyltransferase involved in cell wall biosynthesis
MKLLVSIDQHFVWNGRHVYSLEGTAPYEFFRRSYLEVFEQLMVLGRLRTDLQFEGCPEAIVDGPNLEFFALPEFRGPFQYVSIRDRVVASIREAIPKADAYLLRGPGTIGRPISSELERCGRPYAVQVIGDPWTMFGAGRVGGPLRLFYRVAGTWKLKRTCRNSTAVAYVTRSALQRRYPASPGAFSAWWSDVQIEDAIATEGELEKRIAAISELAKRPAVLGFIGTLQVPYKGADVLLHALAACLAQGLKVVAHLVGSGKLQSKYKNLAAKLGIAEQVIFLGQIGAGGPIFRFLDSVDLFVMPSLGGEGLPRAMIEAMARGCPCIGSNVGGIPELLEPADLVEPGDSAALAGKIKQKLASLPELVRTVRRNRNVATNYRRECMRPAELAFLRAVRDRAIAGKDGKPVNRSANRTDQMQFESPLHLR